LTAPLSYDTVGWQVQIEDN